MPLKKQNIEHFVHLIRVALADDIITNDEMILLQRVGKRLGFSESEVINLLETTGKSDYVVPEKLPARFEQVFDIIQVALSDGIIDKNEMFLASGFAFKSGFSEKEIPQLLLLLINGIKEGKKVNELFELYKNKKK